MQDDGFIMEGPRDLDDAVIKLRTLRALEGIEFYLAELLYYRGLEHPEVIYDEDERRDFTLEMLRKYEDYRR